MHSSGQQTQGGSVLPGLFSAGSGDEAKVGEQSESEIDEAIYAPPPEAALPAEVVLSDGPSSTQVTIPTSAMGAPCCLPPVFFLRVWP
jgi:hypothetical protein